jgi:hypothetical protein
VTVEHRRDGTRQLTNHYLVRAVAGEGAAGCGRCAPQRCG